jgi:hypothetical protein
MDYYATAKAMTDGVWLECGTDWLHYANDNHGRAHLSKEEARRLAKELLDAVSKLEGTA